MSKRKESQKLHQKKYLNTRELANRWDTSEAKLEADRHLGRGAPYIKLGGLVRYRLSDVEAYERRMLVDPTNSVAGGR
jgi:hypothetical protein